MKLKTKLLSTAISAGLFLSHQANALNIVLTNDDSWETTNIQVLKTALEDAGHDVIMSAPCTGQSGKGGGFHFFKNVSVDTSEASDNKFCIGDTDTTAAFENYVEGTPVMSALYGIDIAAQEKWGANPDLLISGPNEGNNVGYLNNNSGTLGAAMIALSRGIPAIAVSGDINSEHDPSQAPKIAKVVIQILENLTASQLEGQPLLPAYTGLNINTPADLDNHKGYRFTDVGWNGGGIALTFMSTTTPTTNMVGFELSDVGDSNESSEGVAIQNGYIAVSTIDGNIQAPRAKVAHIQQRLTELTK
ncbi:5'/3'-nucleotidase SurE [Photobacterium makurazakiensis]|uniref:5'/3'-nucleotidase SurE n=1 Tax=Photobacterium makurazakiensis TaxID=2910234 RepID=UPI003D0E3859